MANYLRGSPHIVMLAICRMLEPSVQEGSSVAPDASHYNIPKAAILSFPLPPPNQDELGTVKAVVKITTKAIAALNLPSCKEPGSFTSCP